VDTIGAGDNFSSGYLCYLYEKGIFSRSDFVKIDDDFLLKMLNFSNSTACEALQVKGADVPKDKLLKVKAGMK
jgi:sugar/nucleoside kinase (ribokinase family)